VVHEIRHQFAGGEPDAVKSSIQTECKMSKLVSFVKDESGATAIEYGLIAAATGLALVATMPAIKSALTTTFTTIGTNLN